MKKPHPLLLVIAGIVSAIIFIGLPAFAIKRYVELSRPMLEYNHIQSLAHTLSQVTSEDLRRISMNVTDEEASLTESQIKILLERLRSHGFTQRLPSDYELNDLKGHPYRITIRRSTDQNGHWTSADGTSGPSEFIVSVYPSATDTSVSR